MGSEWSINGKFMVATAVTQATVTGIIADGNTPREYQATIHEFVDTVDFLGENTSFPKWLKSLAVLPHWAKIGDRVKYTGAPAPFVRHYQFPYTVTALEKNQIRCVDANGEVMPKIRQSDLEIIERLIVPTISSAPAL